MNTPLKSKINWTTLIGVIVAGLINIAVAYGRIPADVGIELITMSSTVIGALIILFRSKFTGTKEADE